MEISLREFENGLTAEKLTAWLKDAQRDRVHKKYTVKYAVPEFRIISSHDLTGVFRRHLGLDTLFDKEKFHLDTFQVPAPEKPTALGPIWHHAAIAMKKDIKEELNRFARPLRDKPDPKSDQKSVEFTADRPFFFVVYDVRAQIFLFMGRLADPRKKGQGFDELDHLDNDG